MAVGQHYFDPGRHFSMSVSGGRYCRIGDVTVLQSRAERFIEFHVPCDIGLGSDYSTRGCELKIPYSLSSETGLYMSVDGMCHWCPFS